MVPSSVLKSPANLYCLSNSNYYWPTLIRGEMWIKILMVPFKRGQKCSSDGTVNSFNSGLV